MTYVMFGDDQFVYRYDNLHRMMDSHGMVPLNKDNATMKIETFHTV